MRPVALVSYELRGPVGVIVMDDGRANVLSPTMQSELHSALDQAEADAVAVVLAGRAGRFSGGFDLAVMQAGVSETRAMVIGGFKLAQRLLTFPRPVVAACTGHAIAMAAFLLLACDYRIGAAGDYRIVANEVAIGMTMPFAALELCRQRLAPAYYHRSIILAETFSPETAIDAGFLDRVVDAEGVVAAAESLATDLAALNAQAHAATKLRARAESLTRYAEAIDIDDGALAKLEAGVQ